MMTVITLAAAVLFTALFRKPLKRVPWLFYLLAVALDVFVLLAPRIDMPLWLYRGLVTPNARCLFAFGLFTIVMFTGALKPGSALRRALVPIRAELSIFAALLVFCHVGRYVSVYSPRVLQNPASVGNGILASFVISAVLVILLVLLTVTSLGFVKKRMGSRGWKNLQRLSYVFFALIYLHVLLVMARSALAGGTNALVSVVVYGAILVVYAVMRVRRAKVDAGKLEQVEKGTAE